MQLDKFTTSFVFSCLLLVNSCAPPPLPESRTEWPSVNLGEADFRDYYDDNILDPIEGIWTVSENTTWINVNSGLKGSKEEENTFRIAIIKDKNSIDRYDGFVLESSTPDWTAGRLKVTFRKTARETAYEETWYTVNYSKDVRKIAIDNDRFIRQLKDWEQFPTKFQRETILSKVYPSDLDKSSSTLLPEVKSVSTGFLVSESGLIITNYHVVKDASKIEIAFPNRNLTKTADLKIKDINNDLAVLEIDSFVFSDVFNDGIPFSLADINSVKTGAEVFTLGFPLVEVMGLKSKLSTGRINSVYGSQDDPRLFQISNPLQPGNSGGPLFNMKGELVGVVVSSINARFLYENHGIIPQNVNFAVKVSYLKNLLGMLPENDEISNRKSRVSNLKMEDQIEILKPFIVQIRVY